MRKGYNESMMIAILGRQPKMGLAELEALVGAKNVQPLGEQAALVQTNVDGQRLGGTIKLLKPLTELAYTDWPRLVRYCAEQLPNHLGYIPKGKLKLGLSTYGLKVTSQQLFRAGLELKNVCRAAGRSVRIVPATGTALSSAQTLHNQMTGALGMELVFIKHGHKTWLGQTAWVQDIDDYSRRDYGRPRRDAKVGMLPPKLAQIMLNLATKGQEPQVVLDPFCGTGVVLQEAELMGYSVYGSDIETRMIDFTTENLAWLNKSSPDKPRTKERLEVADATSHHWQGPVDCVVSETYLGQALSGLPAPEKLASIQADCNTIIEKFLKNLRPQLKANATVCLAVPAWYVNKRFRHLPLLDHLEKFGYNRQQFSHTRAEDLIYHREGQIVARELLVVTVK